MTDTVDLFGGDDNTTSDDDDNSGGCGGGDPTCPSAEMKSEDEGPASGGSLFARAVPDADAGEREDDGGGCGGADGGGGFLAQATEAEEKETAAGAAGGGGGSRPRKTLRRMDPEEALRAFAESVGMPVDAMWDGVTRGDGGEIVEIDWNGFGKDLTGALPVGDMHMPYLRNLDLHRNRKLKGEARGVGVAVVKFTDCFCE